MTWQDIVWLVVVIASCAAIAVSVRLGIRNARDTAAHNRLMASNARRLAAYLDRLEGK